MTPIQFSVSEPDEFYLENGDGPFEGVLVGAKSNILFLSVSSDLDFRGSGLRFLAAVPRYGGPLPDLAGGSRVVVNLAPLKLEKKVSEVTVDELASLAGSFRSGHLIGEVWLAR